MSYDIYLNVDTGGEHPISVCDHNYTANMGYALRAAGLDLDKTKGMSAADAEKVFRDASDWIEAHSDELRSGEPANGWGSVEGVVRWLRCIADDCKRHPKTVIDVSR